MILRSMTAVYGRLDGETLALQPGLNVLEAPNEAGKSTWAAFLMAMLYGVDTGQRATRTALPEKAPAAVRQLFLTQYPPACHPTDYRLSGKARLL